MGPLLGQASLLEWRPSSGAAPPWNRRCWAGPPGIWGFPAPALSGRRGPRKTCPETRNPPFSHKARSQRLGGVPCRIMLSIRRPRGRGLRAFRAGWALPLRSWPRLGAPQAWRSPQYARSPVSGRLRCGGVPNWLGQFSRLSVFDTRAGLVYTALQNVLLWEVERGRRNPPTV